MSDQLSSQLASLRIQRDAPRARGGGGRWVALALVAAAGAGLWSQKDELAARFSTRTIKTTTVAVVSPVQASSLFTVTGYLVARRQATVAPRVPGRLARLAVAEGQRVKQGDLIAELEADDAEAALARAAAAVAAARARQSAAHVDTAEARRLAEREKELVDRGISPAEALRLAQARQQLGAANARAAGAEVRAAQTGVRAASVGRDALKVFAPFDGVVVEKLAEVGELVGLGGGDVTRGAAGGLVLLADFSTLQVEAEVTEARVGAIKVGLPAEVTLDAFPERRFRGEVAGLRPSIDRAKATLPVWVKLLDPVEGLLPDMAAKVRFLTEALDEKRLAEKPKQVLPGSALVERGGAKVVFVVREGRAVQTTVTLGAPHGSGFELTAGPAPGEKLVDAPPADLMDGARVEEKDQK